MNTKGLQRLKQTQPDDVHREIPANKRPELRQVLVALKTKRPVRSVGYAKPMEKMIV